MSSVHTFYALYIQQHQNAFVFLFLCKNIKINGAETQMFCVVLRFVLNLHSSLSSTLVYFARVINQLLPRTGKLLLECKECFLVFFHIQQSAIAMMFLS